MKSPSLFHFVVGLCLGAAGASAAVSLDGLTAESPFMPKQDTDNTEAVSPENAALEFRGLYSTKDGVFFGLYDRTRNVGAWVSQKDRGSDFTVRSYDAAADMLTVDYQGQKYTLPLSTSRIATAAPSPVIPVARSVPPAGTPQPAVAAPADATRLESVAAEVRRRRALRQTGGQPSSTRPGGSHVPPSSRNKAAPDPEQ